MSKCVLICNFTDGKVDDRDSRDRANITPRFMIFFPLKKGENWQTSGL